MWITQTYLTSPEPDAKLHVYYLYENYVEENVIITKRIQRSMEGMGHRFGSDVALIMPNRMSADKIESQVRAIKPLWEMVKVRLPGALICTRPMNDIRFEDGEHFFVSFDSNTLLGIEQSAQALTKISKLISDQLEYQHREMGSKEPHLGGRGARFWEAVELKPGIAGFKIDLKILLRRN